jgi:hypothetical protein
MTERLKPSHSAPCPCGSPRAYAACCLPLEGPARIERDEEKRSLVRRAEGTSLEILNQMLRQMIEPADLKDLVISAGDVYAGPSATRLFHKRDSKKAVEQETDYSFGVFLILKLKSFPGDNDTLQSFASLSLQLGRKHFLPDQIQFLSAAEKANYRLLAIKEIVGDYVTLLDFETGQTFTTRDVQLAQSGVKGALTVSMVVEMWGDCYLLGALPQCLPGDWAGRVLLHKEKSLKTLTEAREKAGQPGDTVYELEMARRWAFLEMHEAFRDVPPPPQPPLQEKQAVHKSFSDIQEYSDKVNENWVNEPVPALLGLTPRQAAGSPTMRGALEALLLEWERRVSHLPPTVAGPDVQLLRARLFGEGAQ